MSLLNYDMVKMEKVQDTKTSINILLKESRSGWGGSFCFARKGITSMGEPVTVYCPSCKRKAGVYDGRSSINLFSVCNKCRKMVIYDIQTKETTIEELPQRTTSSGMRFI